jgi:hypothetical protein
MPLGRSRKQRREETSRDTTANDEALLTALEDEWLASRLRGDTDVTERLIDERYQGHTSDGLVQTKADFLSAVQSSGLRYTESEQNERTVRVLGDAAVSTGVIKLRSPERSHSFRYLRVFSKSEGQWRIVASQATRLRAP